MQVKAPHTPLENEIKTHSKGQSVALCVLSSTLKYHSFISLYH